MTSKKYNNNRKLLIASLILLSIVGAVYLLNDYHNRFSPNFSIPKNTSAFVYIYPATTYDDVVLQVEKHGWAKNIRTFKREAQREKNREKLRTGRFQITNRMSNRSFFYRIFGGMQTPVNLKFNNIRHRTQLAERLSQQLMIDSAQIMQFINDTSELKSYGMTPQTVIAMFIPNTYEVYWNVSVKKLFDRMYREYKIFWNADRLAQAKQDGLTPMQVSILASIVEEETNKNMDKPVIAGLYINRLKCGMKLQSDPTVRFAMGDFSNTQVFTTNLNYDSPYNTYKYAGLPPGPIRMPSIDGIDAVLNYTHHDYLYMCAKPEMDGGHNFSATMAQHQRNAALYHAAYRNWKKSRKN